MGAIAGVGVGEAAGIAGAMRPAGELGLGMAAAVRARVRATTVLWKSILSGGVVWSVVVLIVVERVVIWFACR